MNQKRRNQLGWNLLASLLLVGLTIFAYLPSFQGSFHMDDYPNIVGNRYIQINDLHLNTLFQASFQDFRQNRPLSNLTLALNYYFNELNPFGYHLVNFGLFLFASLGLWLLLQRLLVHLSFEKERAQLAGWLCALIWAGNPLNTQAVSYIIQRHILLAGAFYLWTIYFYHLGLGAKKRKWLAFSLASLCSVFALLSKEIALTLPAMLLLYKIYFFDQLKPGILRRNWKWLLALLVFYALIFGFAFRPQMRKTLFNFSALNFGPEERILSQPRVLLWNFFLILFPYPQFLSVEHQFSASRSLLNPPFTLPAFVIVLSLLGFAIIRARKNPLISFALLWYFGVLFVESLPLPIHLVFEHRLYLASLSVIVPAVSFLVLKQEKKRISVCFLLVLSLLFFLLSYQRNLKWKDDISLWGDAVKKAPTSLKAWIHYCNALSLAEKCERARFACQIASASPNSLIIARNSLGICFLKQGKNDLAKKEFLTIIEKSVLVPASVYFNLGLIESLEKNFENAIQWYLKALEQEPKNLKARYNLAQAYQQMSQEELYIQELNQILELAPDSIETRIQLAKILAQKGDCEKAIQLIESTPKPIPELNQILERCSRQ